MKQFLNENKIVISIVSILLIFSFAFYILISRTSDKEVQYKYRIIKSGLTSSKGVIPEVVENNNNTFTISYEAGTKEDKNNYIESFVFDPSYVNDKNLISNSENEGQKSNNNNFKSPFFTCNGTNSNLFYIVLDISKSVSDSIGQDKYINEMRKKLTDILVKENLKPGDEIRIRYLGRNNKENQDFNFIGPEVSYNYNKNIVKKFKTIELIDSYDSSYLNDEICNGKPGLTSKKELIGVLNYDYNEKLKNPELSTNVTEVFKRISEEVKTEKKFKKYGSVKYIVFTDGDSTDGFSSCELGKDNENCVKAFSGLNYSGNDDAYIIWSWDQYKDTLRNVFNNVNVYFQ